MDDNYRDDAKTESTPDDPVGRLIRRAGPAPEPPPAAAARVRAAVELDWRQAIGERARSRRRRRALALAAVLALAVVGARLLWLRGPAPGEPLAVVERAVGTVELSPRRESTERRAGGGQDAAAIVGRSIHAGSTVTTGAEDRVALRLASGVALRLDVGTSLALTDAAEIDLRRGAVYVDSAGAGQISVRTPWGVARDVGTQFEVRLADDGMETRVREGIVEIVAAGASYEVESGERLQLDAAGRVTRRAVSSFGSAWSWTLEIAPGYELEGKTLIAWARWLEGQTGWQVRFEDDDLGRRARETVLHGAVAGMRPDETPAVVLPTCDLDFSFEDGVLTIARPRG